MVVTSEALDTEMFSMSPGSGNMYIWGSKVKGEGHEARKTVPAWIFALL